MSHFRILPLKEGAKEIIEQAQAILDLLSAMEKIPAEKILDALGGQETASQIFFNSEHNMDKMAIDLMRIYSALSNQPKARE